MKGVEDTSGEIKWFKLASDFLSNKKIRVLKSMPEGMSLIVIWIGMLGLASDTNDFGLVYFKEEIPYTDQLLATVLDFPVQTIQLALSTFEKMGMIEVIDDIIKISNWAKYQSVDKMADIREYNRIKKQESRERQRLNGNVGVNGHVNDMSMTCQTDVNENVKVFSNISISNSSSNTVKGDNEEENTGSGGKEKKPKRERKAFVKPTVEEVIAYCKERNNGIDGQYFFDKYEGNGWVDKNGNPMKDWKATIRTWEKWEKEKDGQNRDNPHPNLHPRTIYHGISERIV